MIRIGMFLNVQKQYQIKTLNMDDYFTNKKYG